jgi:hypothetical protein
MKTLGLWIAALVLGMASASAARADTCTLTGTFKYEPIDYYYCDTDFFQCGGWTQVDLDKKRVANGSAAPLRFMKVSIWKADGTTLLATTHTDGSGRYTKSFNVAGACAGQQVKVRHEFTRVHENDVIAATPRYRFRMVNAAAQNWRTSPITVPPLTGATTTFNSTRRAPANPAAPSDVDRLYSTYFSMEAGITQMMPWSTNVNTHFYFNSSSLALQLRLKIHSGNTSDSFYQGGQITLAWNDYAAGFTIRHELGHAVHEVVHRLAQNGDGTCYSYTFGGGAEGIHNIDSCF